MMIFCKHDKSKGQTFLLSVLLLSAVSIMGITLITIFNHDLKLSCEFTESTKALYAADSEMERLLYWTLVEGKGGYGSSIEETPLVEMKNNTSAEGDATNFSLSTPPSYLITLGYNNKATVSRGMRIDLWTGD